MQSMIPNAFVCPAPLMPEILWMYEHRSSDPQVHLMIGTAFTCIVFTCCRYNATQVSSSRRAWMTSSVMTTASVCATVAPMHSLTRRLADSTIAAESPARRGVSVVTHLEPPAAASPAAASTVSIVCRTESLLI